MSHHGMGSGRLWRGIDTILALLEDPGLGYDTRIFADPGASSFKTLGRGKTALPAFRLRYPASIASRYPGFEIMDNGDQL